jgi:hypothetical protein
MICAPNSDLAKPRIIRDPFVENQADVSLVFFQPLTTRVKRRKGDNSLCGMAAAKVIFMNKCGASWKEAQ